MIIDLNSFSNSAVLSADLCVVGTGAAGLALALAMRDHGLSVLLLEGGGAELEADAQSLYDCEISGLPFAGHATGRFRVLGGSTTRWGGQASPLGMLDFAERSWVPNSGWPLSLDDLAPYFPLAAAYMGIDRLDFETEPASKLRYRPPAFDSSLVHFHFAKWSPRPNLWERYRESLTRAHDVTILLHANVMEIRLTDNLSAVKEMRVRSLSGATGVVRAARFVLAAGGIETARLLLLSDRQSPGGVGNKHGNVGCFFQDHPASDVGFVRSPDVRRLQHVFGKFHRRGLAYSVRMSAAAAWQRANRLLNVSGTLRFVPHEASVYESLRQGYLLLRSGKLGWPIVRHAAHGITGIASAMPSLWHFYVRGRTYIPDPRVIITLIGEQEPVRESRISLSASTDALGQRRARVNWQVSEATRDTFIAYGRVLKKELERLGLCEVELEPWLGPAGETLDWHSRIVDQGHHIGATRMSQSPANGVVDANLRVHGIDNLYIASTSVFPTGGHSNPTFNMLALVFRLANRLKSECREAKKTWSH